MDKLGEGVKTGVLLVNLGSPSAPSTKAIRDFLRPFLSDPKVVPMSRWLWLPLLHGVILRKRPAQLVTEYQRIWTSQGSPLQVYSDGLRERVSRWALHMIKIAAHAEGKTLHKKMCDFGTDGILPVTYSGI